MIRFLDNWGCEDESVDLLREAGTYKSVLELNRNSRVGADPSSAEPKEMLLVLTDLNVLWSTRDLGLGMRYSERISGPLEGGEKYGFTVVVKESIYNNTQNNVNTYPHPLQALLHSPQQLAISINPNKPQTLAE
jgi:hypothetical protein